MPEQNPDIDLDRPGKLASSAENAHDYTIWLVLASGGYTAQAVQANPASISEKHILAKGGPYPADGGKDATLELGKFIEAMRPKLSRDGKTPVKGIVLATPTSGNAKKRKAVVEDYTMLGPVVHVTRFVYGEGDVAAILASNPVEDGHLDVAPPPPPPPVKQEEQKPKDPKVVSIDASIEFGASANIALEGEPGVDYTLVITPQDASKGAKTVTKGGSPLGAIGGDGTGKGSLVLDAPDFSKGTYDVVMKAGGKESPKAPVKLTFQGDVWTAGDDAKDAREYRSKDWKSIVLSGSTRICMTPDGSVITSSPAGALARLDPDADALKDAVTGVPQADQIWPDPDTGAVYGVEYASPGRVFRANPADGSMEILTQLGGNGRGCALVGDVLFVTGAALKSKLGAIWLKEKNRLETFLDVGGNGELTYPAPSVDGSELYLGIDETGTVARIDLKDRVVKQRYQIPGGGRVFGIAVQADGKLLVSTWKGGIVRLDPASGAAEKVAPEAVRSIWVAGAEKRKLPTPPKSQGILAAGHNTDEILHKIDLKTGVCDKVGPAFSGGLGGVVIDQNNRIFISRGAYDGTVNLVDKDAGTSKVIGQGFGYRPGSLCNDPDTNDLYMIESGGNVGSIWRINPDTGAQEKFVTGFDAPLGMAFAEGYIYLTTMNDKTLWAINKTTKRKYVVCALPFIAREMTFDETGDHCYLAGVVDDKVYRLNLNDCKIDKEWPGVPSSGLFLENADSLVVSAHGQGTISRLTLSTGELKLIANCGEPVQLHASDKPYPRYKSKWKPIRRLLVAGNNANQLFHVDGKNGSAVAAPIAATAGSNVIGVVVDQKKRTFFTDAMARTIVELDPAGGARVVATLPSFTYALANDPETNDLYATVHDFNLHRNTGRVFRVNPDTGAQEEFAAFGVYFQSIAVAQDYVYVVPNGDPSLGGDPTLYAIHKATKKREKVASLPNERSGGIFFDGAGANAFVGVGGRICRVNLQEGKVDREYPGLGSPGGAAIDEDGTTFVTDTLGHRVLRLDLESGAVTPIGQVGQNPSHVAIEDQPYPRYKSQFVPK